MDNDDIGRKGRIPSKSDCNLERGDMPRPPTIVADDTRNYIIIPVHYISYLNDLTKRLDIFIL